MRELKTRSVRIASFAKINWVLRVLGKRVDGYHEVETILQTISLCDELIFTLRNDDEIILTCDDPEIPVDKSNLIVKAALALKERLRSKGGVEIAAIKRIPAKGGLGGASSNAAVTLRALNALWRGNLSDDDLAGIGAGLGSDVPFFFIGGRCVGKGTGTRLLSIADGPKQSLIVVTPNAKVSTATAYESLNARSLTTSNSDSILSSSFAGQVFDDSVQWRLHNDFERVIFEIEPEIERVKVALLDAGARGALLAGSGSSVFGVFSDAETRNSAREKLHSEAGWEIFSCETVSRDEYLSALNSSAMSRNNGFS